MKLKAILFDMDGVLVDTEEFIYEATRLMFAEHGVCIKEEDALSFVGTGENSYITGIGMINNFVVDINRDKPRTYAIYEQLVKGRINTLPGVKTFIQKCKSLGLKLAVASSADRIKVDINLRESGLSHALFDAIISGEDVERKKPFPDIYLLAANQLGVPIQSCLVIEDAVSGVKAGKTAGAKCLAVTTSFSAEKLCEADRVVEMLEDINPAALDVLWS